MSENGSVTISMSEYNRFKEMEKAISKECVSIRHGFLGDDLWLYYGKDERIKELVADANGYLDSLKKERSKKPDTSLRARIAFLFAGQLEWR